MLALAAKPLMDMAGGAMDGGAGPSSAESNSRGGSGPVINFGGGSRGAGYSFGMNVETGIFVLVALVAGVMVFKAVT